MQTAAAETAVDTARLPDGTVSLCAHCHQHRAHKHRGLCHTCYNDPLIRPKYRSSHPRANRFPSDAVLQERARIARLRRAVFNGSASAAGGHRDGMLELAGKTILVRESATFGPLESARLVGGDTRKDSELSVVITWAEFRRLARAAGEGWGQGEVVDDGEQSVIHSAGQSEHRAAGESSQLDSHAP